MISRDKVRKRKRTYEGEPEKFVEKLVWHFHRKRRKLAKKYLGERRHYDGEPTEILKRVVWHFHRKRRKFVEKMFRRQLEKAVARDGLTWVGTLVLRILQISSLDYKILPLRSYSSIAQRSYEVAREVIATVEAPARPKGVTREARSIMPPLKAYVFCDAEVASNSTAVVSGGVIGVPEFYVGHPKALISDPKFLIWHSSDGLGVIPSSPAFTHSEGLMLFSHGSPNWYHWLLENLPLAFLSKGLPDGLSDFPLVVPNRILEVPTFRDSLELLRDGREIVGLGDGIHRFKRLVSIDSPVREPMNLRVGSFPVLNDYSFNETVLREYRSEVMRRLDLPQVDPQRRIFLARDNKRRSYNQDDLLDICRKYDVVPVQAELLSFRQQVELLSTANLVVGPSGAAFANTLFCQPQTRLLSWLPPQYTDFCSYTNVAKVTKSRLRFLFSHPDRPIRSSFDAFAAGYTVDANEFESSLRAALEDAEF